MNNFNIELVSSNLSSVSGFENNGNGNGDLETMISFHLFVSPPSFFMLATNVNSGNDTSNDSNLVTSPYEKLTNIIWDEKEINNPKMIELSSKTLAEFDSHDKY